MFTAYEPWVLEKGKEKSLELFLQIKFDTQSFMSASFFFFSDSFSSLLIQLLLCCIRNREVHSLCAECFLFLVLMVKAQKCKHTLYGTWWSLFTEGREEPLPW